MLKGLRTLFSRRVLFNVEMNNSVDCELLLIQQQLQGIDSRTGQLFST